MVEEKNLNEEAADNIGKYVQLSGTYSKLFLLIRENRLNSQIQECFN